MDDNKHKIQYTKIIIMMVVIWSMFIVTVSYILQASDHELHEALSIRVVELIIIAIVVYCIKAFLENRAKR